MTQYIAVVHKDPDSAYGVHFPDVEGCFSAADDIEDLLPNAMKSLALMAEQATMRAPRDIEEIRRDPEIREALASGAFLLSVPLPATMRPVRVNVSMDERTLSMIDAAAEARNLSRSAFLGYAARQVVERNL